MPTPAQLRSDLLLLTDLAASDLDELWRLVSTAAEAREAIMDVLPALIGTYSEAASTVAADWYDDLRDEATSTPDREPAQMPSGWSSWVWLRLRRSAAGHRDRDG